MSDAMTLNVRIGGALRDHARVEVERFQALKAELQRAFATPLSEYVIVIAEDVIGRNASIE